MTIGEIIGLVVCMFAAIGAYLLFCKLVSHLTTRTSISLCVRASDCEDSGELDAAVKTAAAMSIGSDTVTGRPVLIFDSPEDVVRLSGRDYDLDIYIKYPGGEGR